MTDLLDDLSHAVAALVLNLDGLRADLALLNQVLQLDAGVAQARFMALTAALAELETTLSGQLEELHQQQLRGLTGVWCGVTCQLSATPES